MREAALEAACCRYARKRGVRPVKLQGGPAGDPDRLFLLPKGVVLVVEFKTLTGRLSPRQVIVHEEYARLRHPVFVVRETVVFKNLLDALLA